MTYVIHKHDLRDPITDLNLFAKASILFVGVQGMSIRLWEMHDAEEEEKEIRTFTIVATGQRTKVDPIQYIGSVMLDEGRVVFHIFETTDRQREPSRAVTPTRQTYAVQSSQNLKDKIRAIDASIREAKGVNVPSNP